MGGVAIAWIEGVQAAGEEESIFQQAVVEMVVHEVPQLGVYAGWRRHGGGNRAGVCCFLGQSRSRSKGKSIMLKSTRKNKYGQGVGMRGGVEIVDLRFQNYF